MAVEGVGAFGWEAPEAGGEVFGAGAFEVVGGARHDRARRHAAVAEPIAPSAKILTPVIRAAFQAFPDP